MALAGVLPFLIADPGAFYDDTVRYGAGTYKIVGYGLSAILVRLGVLDDRDGELPVRAAGPPHLGAADRLAAAGSAPLEELWVGAAGFAISILWLMFIGRTFNNYYLLWPMTGRLRCSAPSAALLVPASLPAALANANCWARPVTYTRSASATTGLAYLPPGKRHT